MIHRVLSFQQSPWLNPIKPGGGLFVPAAFYFVDNFLHETVMGLKFYDFS